MNKNRREFIKGVSGLGLGLFGLTGIEAKPHKSSFPTTKRTKKIEEICVFSKHLQFLGYEEMAEAAAEMGFDGVDLTVRPGGHVLPENVEKDLPRAVNAVKEAGLKVPMMASGVNDPDHPLTEKVLATAADTGISHYRMAYYHYDFNRGIQESLSDHKKKLEGLIKLNEKHGIVGNYQNHAGNYVGAPVWDLHELFREQDPQWIGCQYDIRHATVEGGHSWEIDLHLIHPWIRTLVIKDFRWGKAGGQWRTINTPVGEGQVPFESFFKYVSALETGGPVTIHFEYDHSANPLDQMDKKSAKMQTMGHMQKDLQVLRDMLGKEGLVE